MRSPTSPRNSPSTARVLPSRSSALRPPALREPRACARGQWGAPAYVKVFRAVEGTLSPGPYRRLPTWVGERDDMGDHWRHPRHQDHRHRRPPEGSSATPEALRLRSMAEVQGLSDGSAPRWNDSTSGATLVRGERFRKAGVEDQTPRQRRHMRYRGTKNQFVICVDSEGYSASLERWKVYRALPDGEADAHGLLRVIDESGEDYLYPKDRFRPIQLPQHVRRLYREKTAA